MIISATTGGSDPPGTPAVPILASIDMKTTSTCRANGASFCKETS